MKNPYDIALTEKRCTGPPFFFLRVYHVIRTLQQHYTSVNKSIHNGRCKNNYGWDFDN